MQDDGDTHQQLRVNVLTTEDVVYIGTVAIQFACQPRYSAFLVFQFLLDDGADEDGVLISCSSSRSFCPWLSSDFFILFDLVRFFHFFSLCFGIRTHTKRCGITIHVHRKPRRKTVHLIAYPTSMMIWQYTKAILR